LLGQAAGVDCHAGLREAPVSGFFVDEIQFYPLGLTGILEWASSPFFYFWAYASLFN
jgi:hypothetical protein